MRADARWEDRALCAEIDPELHFPEVGESTKKPKAVCRSCEVRVPCLRAALERHEPSGIWGGFSEHERRVVARQHRLGRSLEDIIAEDDEAYYVRLEVAA